MVRRLRAERDSAQGNEKASAERVIEVTLLLEAMTSNRDGQKDRAEKAETELAALKGVQPVVQPAPAVEEGKPAQ